MNEFIEQQDERTRLNHELLRKAHEALASQVLGEQAVKGKKDAEQKSAEVDSLPSKPLGLRSLLIFMLKALNGWDAVYVVLAFLTVSLLGMFTPYVTKQFMDEMIPSGQDDLMLPLGCLLLSATIGTTLFTVSRTLVMQRTCDKMTERLNAGLIDRVFHLPATFFRAWTSGELGQRLISMMSTMQNISQKAFSAILSLLFALVYFYQINLYAPQLLGMSATVLVIQYLLMTGFVWFAQKEQSRVIAARSRLSGLLYSLMGGIRKIKSSGAEERAYAKWAFSFCDAMQDRHGRNRFLVFYPALTTLVATGTMVLTYYYTMEAKICLSDYLAFLSAYGMVTTAVSAMADMLPDLAGIRPSLDLCKPILETIPEVEDSTGHKVEFLSGAIEITGLKFRYNEDSPYIFNDLSLKINPCEYVAIVGPSGCGKSTLIRLLLGFEKAESGSIFFDSYSIDTVNLPSLRRQIGTCLQDGRLFNGELFENLTITAPLSKEEDVWEAARLACLDEDIKAMPMGLHTLLGDGGGGISGGQRQRVLIARALVGKPSILIFDEATSALDNVTQKRVTENLDSLCCTRICIAHRLSTIRNCDRIIVLNNGCVAEEGTFDELIEKQGLFYELAKRQMA